MTLLEEVQRLREKCSALEAEVSTLKSEQRSTNEQINGERGLAQAIKEVSKEIADFRVSANRLLVGIAVAAVAWGFSVLTFL